MSILGEVPSPLYQVLICGTVLLLQFWLFWETNQNELANEGPHTVSIGGMRIRLPQLEDNNKEAKKLRLEGLLEGWEDIEQVFYYQSLSYVPKVIRSKLISRHHNYFLAGHFSIEKSWELIAKNYYWPTPRRDVEAYIKDCDNCLASKIVYHKSYRELQSLFVPTHWQKNLSIDFIIGLSISADWKSDSYNSILVIVDQPTKIIHYLPVKVTIDIPALAEVIIDVILLHYGVPELIVTDQGQLFTLKF